MNELQIYSNEIFGSIRTLAIDDEPWFAGRDVAAALGYSDTKSAIADHVDEDDKRLFKRGQIATLDDQRSENATFDIPNRGLTIINESGVYSLIFSSQLETAKQFKRWVTHDVLPAIRKQGYYSAIPDNQLAEILIANMNDKDKLEHVIIPAMRDTNVEQIRLVARYMGLDPKSVPQKLFSVSDDNRRAKRMIDEWHRHNQGDYTINDFPEPYDTDHATLVSIDTAKRSKCSYGKFAKYCGAVHFNQAGYLMIIEIMRRKKFITPEVAREWEYDVRGIREEARI